ncbi:hypothetical protein CDCA_CDCA14G3816 [Cyanidium caldarium]|uniref:Uncharacterized protein n=1 Tax=Cyanidium caldarium TaxID=2771 RepID=A0AAV9J0H9_CYACA|nr:hypothetical protein CDCA_CDCA14G3816 [Cyanidium caldarium]
MLLTIVRVLWLERWFALQGRWSALGLPEDTRCALAVLSLSDLHGLLVLLHASRLLLARWLQVTRDALQGDAWGTRHSWPRWPAACDSVHALRRNWAAALEHEWRLLRELSGASAADVDAAPQLLLIAVDRCVASAVAYRAAIVHGPSGILVDSVGGTNRPTADLTARLLQYSDVALAYSCCPAPSANTSVWHEFLDSLRDRYPHSGVVCCIGAGTGEIT